MKEQLLQIIDGDDAALDVTTCIEPVPEKEDEIGRLVRTIANKCHAIDSLFESIGVDLGLIAVSHADANAQAVARELKSRFWALEDYVYETIHDLEDSDWEDYGLLEILRHCIVNGRQTLIVPHLRAAFKMCREDEPDDQVEAEFKKHLAHIRSQFELSDDFN